LAYSGKTNQDGFEIMPRFGREKAAAAIDDRIY
jgi:hypothetical protein